MNYNHLFIIIKIIVVALIIYIGKSDLVLSTILAICFFIILIYFSNDVEPYAPTYIDAKPCNRKKTMDDLANEVLKRKAQFGRKIKADELKTICINVINDNDGVEESCHDLIEYDTTGLERTFEDIQKS